MKMLLKALVVMSLGRGKEGGMDLGEAGGR